MSKKKKKKQISSESKTCFTICAVCLLCGIIAVIYGNVFYNNVVDLEDVQTGLTAEVVSVDTVDRNLSPKDKDLEKDKGYQGDELLYELNVGYKVVIDEKEYTYSETQRYHNDNSKNPKPGDTDVINAAVIDGELIVHPETKGANQFNISGYFLLVVGVLAGAIGLFLRK